MSKRKVRTHRVRFVPVRLPGAADEVDDAAIQAARKELFAISGLDPSTFDVAFDSGVGSAQIHVQLQGRSVPYTRDMAAFAAQCVRGWKSLDAETQQRCVDTAFEAAKRAIAESWRT